MSANDSFCRGLSFLHLTDEEVLDIEKAIDDGTIAEIERSYGKCRISRTSTPGVIWVQHIDSSGRQMFSNYELVLKDLSKGSNLDISKNSSNFKTSGSSILCTYVV